MAGSMAGSTAGSTWNGALGDELAARTSAGTLAIQSRDRCGDLSGDHAVRGWAEGLG